MRPIYGDDYGIACCVSAMTMGKQMQYFGARCNLAKSLLYAINGGRDERSGKLVVPGIPKLEGEFLNFDEVWRNYGLVLEYVASQYVDAINIIHYMHDKYAYEAGLMALHDTKAVSYTHLDVYKRQLIMHPGPVNRGVEIGYSFTEEDFSLIEEQVTCGVAVRMATLETLLQGEEQ